MHISLSQQMDNGKYKNVVLFEGLEKFALNIDILPLSRGYNLSFSVSQLSNVGIDLGPANWVLLVNHSYH